jgi:hypothetical protein
MRFASIAVKAKQSRIAPFGSILGIVVTVKWSTKDINGLEHFPRKN